MNFDNLPSSDAMKHLRKLSKSSDQQEMILDEILFEIQAQISELERESKHAQRVAKTSKMIAGISFFIAITTFLYDVVLPIIQKLL